MIRKHSDTVLIRTYYKAIRSVEPKRWDYENELVPRERKQSAEGQERYCFLCKKPLKKSMLRIRIRIHVFLGLPDPDPLVRGMDLDPDPAPDPDPSIIKQI